MTAMDKLRNKIFNRVVIGNQPQRKSQNAKGLLICGVPNHRDNLVPLDAPGWLATSKVLKHDGSTLRHIGRSIVRVGAADQCAKGKASAHERSERDPVPPSPVRSPVIPEYTPPPVVGHGFAPCAAIINGSMDMHANHSSAWMPLPMRVGTHKYIARAPSPAVLPAHEMSGGSRKYACHQ